MSPKSLPKKSDFIPVSTAVTLVSYSRDYIGRLAREGKILAEQIDREWFVSRQSLINFFENSSLEESAKKKILSLSRKNDIEVKDFYTRELSRITAKQSKFAGASAILTLMVMLGGFGSGYIFYTNSAVLTATEPAAIADTLMALTVGGQSQSANVLLSQKASTTVFAEGMVIETNEVIPMEGGVVLFPTVRDGNPETVEQLFSDEVTVIVTSTTTGFIRSSDGTSELPFVRVPNSPSL